MDSIDEWKDDALDNIQEVDELDVKDIRVRPDIYIHFGILKAQNCLNK